MLSLQYYINNRRVAKTYYTFVVLSHDTKVVLNIYVSDRYSERSGNGQIMTYQDEIYPDSSIMPYENVHHFLILAVINEVCV